VTEKDVVQLTREDKIKLIADNLQCTKIFVEKAIAQDDTYYRSCSTLLNPLTTVGQIVKFYHANNDNGVKALRCRAAIKKLYEIWPDSAQENTKKDGE